MSHIFVSYASEDRDRIMPVVRALEATGWSVFWDTTIPVGETWQKIIGGEIDACRCMVVIWSATSINKEWVYEEASEGKRRGVLAPVLIDNVIPPIGFRGIQAAKLEGWDGKAASTEFDRLVKDISRMLGTPPIDPEAARRAEIKAAKKRDREPKAEEDEKQGEGFERKRIAAERTWRSAFSSKFPIEVKVLAAVLAIVVVAVFWVLLRSRSNKQRAEIQKGETQVEATKPTSIASQQKQAIQKAETKVEAINPKSVVARLNPVDGLTYVYIPPGNFTMGCSQGDAECYDNEKPPHDERIPNGFWLCQTEVTQAAWKKVNRSNSNPSRFQGDDHPVENVDWEMAKKYCNSISGRLPTEKEWEYAARAGTRGARYGDLDDIAWFEGNSDLETHPVGKKQPNAWALYDMLGNVSEWTADNYDSSTKTIRGGSWNNNTGYVRASLRGRGVPASRVQDLGFRCVGEFR